MAYTKEQARAQVEALVANFRANEASLADVPEAQIEDNYIRKLFRYLNWNTDNTGLSVAEWEFVLQRTDDKGKRPDYILQLDGQQLLVMDAKKVKYDMHDPRWVTQVYAYAYSTQSMPTHRKIDFALLTDFQELILLDCTLYAADSKAVGNFRILDWTYADYALQFDTLWELFERENMRSAAATRTSKAPAGLWAQYLSPKKVKANRIAPDKAFLAEMDDEKTGWRVRLAKDMKKHNPAAGGALITAAVQLLIDRLIFIKALSDREIEADYLSELAAQVEKAGLAAGDAGWFNACRDIFSKLNQFYNGSIFEPRPELESVTVSNKVVREVLRDLQPENSPYNFAVLPVELLGTIYERFLGRVVHATDARVRIEEKPEVRKAGGVFYTPQYIVEYIVQTTLGALLDKCKTPADAAKLKILDPACGSGSFLLGAYAALIKWHTDWYSDKQRLTQQDREAAYYDSDGRVRLTAKLKRQILLNNLFGVDIDAQAVEVTRFSLSLKALEDTRRDELYEEVSLFKQSVLPDLRYNIKSGNTLIGPDYFTGQMMLDPNELLRVKPFDWANEFAVVMAHGGFDALIGNPPYIRAENMSREERDYWQSAGHFKCIYGRFDIFILFIERGLQVLGSAGRLGFIVPATLLSQNYSKTIRRLILDECRIENIVDLSNNRVFEQAAVSTCVIILRKDSRDDSRMNNKIAVIRQRDYSKGIIGQGASEATVHEIRQGVFDTTVDSMFRLDMVDERFAFLRKLESMSVTIGALCHVNPGLVPHDSKTGASKDRLIHDIRVDSRCRPYVESKDAPGRFGGVRAVRFIQYVPEQMHRGKFPELFENPKILVQDIIGSMGRLIATFDDSGVYTNHSFNVCVLKHLLVDVRPAKVSADDAQLSVQYDTKYVLGTFNSRLLTFYFRTAIGGGLHASPANIRRIPIHAINFSDPADKGLHDTMVQLVESMLALHKHKAAAQTQPEQELLQRQIDITDRQIDALVYELYELTPAEIAIVEGAG